MRKELRRNSTLIHYQLPFREPHAGVGFDARKGLSLRSAARMYRIFLNDNLYQPFLVGFLHASLLA